jgi:peptidoglycan/LPS O-acetylase OafA/YrhL
MQSPPHKIPSLDGLRAVSILLVILSHCLYHVPVNGRLQFDALAVVAGSGATGVSVFFVISGFLITSLLIKEKERFGNISLRGFYLRRVFRILPAFYLYLAVVAALAWLGIIAADKYSFAKALTFTTDYGSRATTWVLGHTWSLSVEEQFYLLWPLLVVVSSKKTLVRIAFAVILIEPFLRVAWYFAFPLRRVQMALMGHTRADTLMFGCLAALLYDQDRFQAFVARTIREGWAIYAAVFLLIVSPIIELRMKGSYIFTAEYPLEAFSITLVMLYLIRRYESPAGVIFNSRIMVHVGILSYSLYLWQEMFLGERGYSLVTTLARVLCVFLAAEASYFLVERPFLGIRRRLERERLAGPMLRDASPRPPA